MAAVMRTCALLAQVTLGVAGSIACYDGKANFAQAQWPYCQQVHESLLFYYGVTADGDYLKLGLYAANQQGWTALALAGNGGMKGSQSIVVRQDNGVWVAEERYATAYSTPVMQETQEVTLIFATEESGDTAWGVLLPMKSCKAGERYPIEDISRWMLWAMGSSHLFGFHSSRKGQFHANLISGPKTPPDFSGKPEVELRMNNVDVVLGQGGTDPTNPYICGIFDLAELLPSDKNIADKHHVIKMSPILNSTNEKYLHHMLLYGCNVGIQHGMQFKHGDVIQECESMPRGCYDIKYAWAVGSEDVMLPADVGMPFGGTVRWLALQFHYYNPRRDTGVKDNSGVRLTFDTSVRSQDAAMLEINGGTSPHRRPSLEPGQDNLVLPTMVIPKEVTETMPNDLNILAVVHHGHLIGKSFKMEVTNGGNYVGMLRHEKMYDFNHQSFEEPSLKMLRKGDDLTFECTYDTSARTEKTEFGDSTQNEMCWGALLYYPAMPVAECQYCGNFGAKRCIYCDGMNDRLDFFAPSVNPPQCQAKGDLSSTEATSILDSLKVVHNPTTTVKAGTSSAVNAVARIFVNWPIIAVLAGGLGH